MGGWNKNVLGGKKSKNLLAAREHLLGTQSMSGIEVLACSPDTNLCSSVFTGMSCYYLIEIQFEFGVSDSNKISAWYNFVPRSIVITLKKNHVLTKILQFHSVYPPHFCCRWGGGRGGG